MNLSKEQPGYVLPLFPVELSGWLMKLSRVLGLHTSQVILSDSLSISVCCCGILFQLQVCLLFECVGVSLFKGR